MRKKIVDIPTEREMSQLDASSNALKWDQEKDSHCFSSRPNDEFHPKMWLQSKKILRMVSSKMVLSNPSIRKWTEVGQF